jgi:beta-galactosidase
MKSCKYYFLIVVSCLQFHKSVCQNDSNPPVREKLSFDTGWLFALGNSSDATKDFNNGTGYFSYFAKAGYGDGAASKDFDDRAWRKLDIPHDWCVELPFDSAGGHSHGYKAIGRNFPENSAGWYRKKFTISASDTGKRISIRFDGVQRNSIVWVNGFYLGTEHSGYATFSYDITDYLNYGGINIIAVRADASMEEGWYYEGAGIYRHVWLLKTSPLHIPQFGTFVTSDIIGNNALITARTNVINESPVIKDFDIEQTIVNAEGKVIATGKTDHLSLNTGDRKEYFTKMYIDNPELWSLEKPYLHKLKTVIRSEGKVVDNYETTFGIRTVKFDPDEGFFLNGKHIKILGACMHQDHAGIGTAIPDALQEYRIKRLKEMGVNGIRTSHNPPTPELLDACDRLGVLVLDENRLMGSNEEHFSCLERLIRRDRNHPSVVIWSMGNEEWAIETNIYGARITTSMQNFAQRLDSSRAFTTALSGGWDNGSGMSTQVAGYNYIEHGDIDGHHKMYPQQGSIGTEETNTHQTRGIYFTDLTKSYFSPFEEPAVDIAAETGWKFYNARPFLSGLFYWTGFDYRGESNPFNWPAVINQSGSFDLCGFQKDIFYYFKSWWGTTPVLHILPHWNWKGKEGKDIAVTVFSNCDQVELFLNNQSLGKKDMPVNSHLVWKVNYKPGVLKAKGYKNGKEIITDKVETTGEGRILQLTADKNTLSADGTDVSVVTVQIKDANGLSVPEADYPVRFNLEGSGKIIGVGNGDPTSHEAERYFESVKAIKIENLREHTVVNLINRPEVAPEFDDSGWKPAFKSSRNDDWRIYKDTLLVIRGTIDLPEFTNNSIINLFTKSIVENQSVYINGHLLEANVRRDAPGQSYCLEHSIIKPGKNVFALTGQRFKKKHLYDEPNTDPGLVQITDPAGQWKRNTFNGLAQVIVQSGKEPGELILKASANGLRQGIIKIQSLPVIINNN